MLCAGLVLTAHPARAQATTFWLDAGASNVRQPGSIARAAGTLGLGAEYRTLRFAVTGDGAATMADDSIGAMQLVLRTQFAPVSWTVGEFEASTTTVGIAMPGQEGNRALLFRQHVQRGAVRVFAGAGVGRTSRFSLDSRSAVQQLGASSARGALGGAFGGSFTGSLTLQRATTNDWQLIEAAGIVLKAPASSYGLHDAALELAWQRARFAGSASYAWRAGFGETRGTGQGHAFAASWRVAGPITLVAQGGRQLADPLRGIPQATYAGAMVRIQRGRTALPRSRDARTGGVTVFDSVSGAEVRLLPNASGGGADLTVTIEAPVEAVVEVASSASEWNAVRLTRTGRAFTVRMPLASGSHHVAVRVNGGPWRAPRGLARVVDDFGGSAGLVVVP